MDKPRQTKSSLGRNVEGYKAKFTLEKKLYEQIKALAKERGITPAQYIREAVTEKFYRDSGPNVK